MLFEEEPYREDGVREYVIPEPVYGIERERVYKECHNPFGYVEVLGDVLVIEMLM